MSLAKIKAKENKGKQKCLPKLKTILANPVRKRSPTLGDDELECLQNIVQTSISSSGIESTKYATLKHIHLGLESSLRAINSQTSSCVFISLSIKPNHIVSLVSRNAEVKDETQPVYAQPCLEDFTEKLFGIRALCMVFPKDLKAISEDLWKWVEQRRKAKRSTNIREFTRVKKTKSKTIQPEADIKLSIETSEETKEQFKSDDKSWKGEYISFDDNTTAKGKFNVVQDENEALDTLSRIMDSVPKVQLKPAAEVVPMEVVTDCATVLEEPKATKDKDVESDDSVDFLDDYKSLVVHRIKPNPNKKPKKKRNKNKNKNLTK